MSLITLLCVLILAGVLAWIIQTAPFISEPYKGYAKWVLLVVVVLWIALTLLGPFQDIRIPTRHG